MDWSQIAGQLVALGAPTLGGIVGGPAGAAIGGLVGKMVAGALGVEATPEAVKAKIEQDPELAKAQIRQVEEASKDELAEIQARLLDTQNARAMQAQLVEAKSPIAYGPSIYATAIVLTFVAVLFIIIFRPVELAQGWRDVLSIMLGVLINEVKACGAFFMGSSQSSREKDALISTVVRANAMPSPTQVASKAMDVAKQATR